VLCPLPKLRPLIVAVRRGAQLRPWRAVLYTPVEACSQPAAAAFVSLERFNLAYPAAICIQPANHPRWPAVDNQGW